MGFFGLAGKALLGGGGRRMFTGSAIGATVGGVTSENQSSTGIFRNVLGGAIAGAGIGGLTTKFAGRTMGSFVGVGANRSVFRSPATKLLGFGYDTAKMGATAGIGAATFAIRHPRATFGMLGIGAGMYGFTSSGPSTQSLSRAEMSAIATAHGQPSTSFDINAGSSRQRARRMLENSTHGLTFGLHQGRH